MVDLAAFRRVCHKVASRARGEVAEFRISDGVAPNFHQGVVAFSYRPAVAVVLARDTGVLALAVPRIIDFAESPVLDSGPLTFVDFDFPDLAVALIDNRAFRVLTSAELGSPFDATQWPGISYYDVQYWEPTNLGEALFNYWD